MSDVDVSGSLGTCPLCGREMIAGPSSNKHHLVPRTRGGKDWVWLHRICHNKIHSLFSEKELEREMNTISRLLEHEEIRKFVRWVRKRPPGFYTRHDGPLRRHG